MVISALRYTLTNADGACDKYLKNMVVPLLVEMLRESEVENLRLALMTFNSAIHNKLHLVLPWLDRLLPMAMKETRIRPELVREVQMGPFKHKVDDGLELRKSAYETLYALLEPAVFPRLAPLDASECWDRVVDGITDEHDICILCTLMLSKLLDLAPAELHARLEGLAKKFQAVLSAKSKETAVRQELDKAAEASRSVLKVTVLVERRLASNADAATVRDDAQKRAWAAYYDWALRQCGPKLQAVADEVRDQSA